MSLSYQVFLGALGLLEDCLHSFGGLHFEAFWLIILHNFGPDLFRWLYFKLCVQLDAFDNCYAHNGFTTVMPLLCFPCLAPPAHQSHRPAKSLLALAIVASSCNNLTGGGSWLQWYD